MLARILVVAALGVAAGVAGGVSTEPADACTCIMGERWYYEVVEASPGADPRWRGRFAFTHRFFYSVDSSVDARIYVYMERWP